MRVRIKVRVRLRLKVRLTTFTLLQDLEAMLCGLKIIWSLFTLKRISGFKFQDSSFKIQDNLESFHLEAPRDGH